MKWLVLSTVLPCLYQTTLTLPAYLDSIPNGRKIPHPCSESKYWQGVGHYSPLGGGKLNSFGRDFLASGKKWTVKLCKMDSDGDGLTNGQELGDPHCTWQQTKTPQLSTRISHPGICDPIKSAKCEGQNAFLQNLAECQHDQNGNDFVIASDPELIPIDSDWCRAIADIGVMSMNITMSPYILPSSESGTFCQEIDLPDNGDYQMIAWQPFLVNKANVRQVSLFACEIDEDIDSLNAVGGFKTPSQCHMTPPCGSLAMVWASGMSGRCYRNDAGVPFGRNYFTKAVLQIHYWNKYSEPGIADASGIQAYYIHRRRPVNIGSFAIGQEEIKIPPQTEMTLVSGGGFHGNCSLTSFEPYSKYKMTSILVQMNRLGRFVKVDLKKGRTNKTITLIKEVIHKHPSPPIFTQFTHPLILEPGDNFEIQCGYTSKKKLTWTYFGAEPDDEMCFAFIEVQPQPLNRMFSYFDNIGKTDYCDREKAYIGSCNAERFFANLLLVFATANPGFQEACHCNKFPATSCSSTCYNFLRKYDILDNPCLTEQNGTIFYYLTRFWLISTSSEVYNIQGQIAECSKLASAPESNAECFSARKAVEYRENSASGHRSDRNSYNNNGVNALVTSRATLNSRQLAVSQSLFITVTIFVMWSRKTLF